MFCDKHLSITIFKVLLMNTINIEILRGRGLEQQKKNEETTDYSSLNVEAIYFVLFPSASEPIKKLNL